MPLGAAHGCIDDVLELPNTKVQIESGWEIVARNGLDNPILCIILQLQQ